MNLKPHKTKMYKVVITLILYCFLFQVRKDEIKQNHQDASFNSTRQIHMFLQSPQFSRSERSELIPFNKFRHQSKRTSLLCDAEIRVALSRLQFITSDTNLLFLLLPLRLHLIRRRRRPDRIRLGRRALPASVFYLIPCGFELLKGLIRTGLAGNETLRQFASRRNCSGKCLGWVCRVCVG